MTTSYQPFYDPHRTYDENCEHGPFGAFADGKVYQNTTPAQHSFLGHAVHLPLGIPAGPLPNYNFCKAAFEKGFDLVMYKTVRTNDHPCNEFPNVIPVKTSGALSMEEAANGMETDDDFKDPIAITNSFGVPSKHPHSWQPDMAKAVQAAGDGQVLIASYQGTNRAEGKEAFLQDWILGANLIKETGAKIVELNLSCPNEGTAKLLCHDTNSVETIAKAVRNVMGKDISLLLKMSYFESDEVLEDFILRLAPIVNGFAAINTIAGKIYKPDGTQALPGKNRLISGVCGAPIKWAGLEMTTRINQIRNKHNLDFVIVGTGGVTNADDYQQYIKAGADAVMSATGAMWNPYLAQEIKAQLNA